MTGINAYAGTLSKTFIINPKGTTVKKVKAAKKISRKVVKLKARKIKTK